MLIVLPQQACMIGNKNICLFVYNMQIISHTKRTPVKYAGLWSCLNKSLSVHALLLVVDIYLQTLFSIYN